MDRKLRILFLCTGNACRSQMAEGWARHLKGEALEVHSAGTHPAGVHPRAVQVMAEAGVDLTSHRSKGLDDVLDLNFDYVITLCDHAHQVCPVFPGKAKTVHRAFEDPVFAVGSEEEILAAFRRVRDEIRAFVETLPEALTREVSAAAATNPNDS